MKACRLIGAALACVAVAAGCYSAKEETITENTAATSRQELLMGNRVLIAYVPEWNSLTTPPAPENIPWTKVTHINVAFAGIDKNHKCAWWSDYQGADSGSLAAAEYNVNVPKLISYRNANHPGVKIMLSVGGWTLSYRFSTAVSDATKRAAFADSCMDMMEQYGFDGLDWDWEYPGKLGPTSGDGSCKAGETCQRAGDAANFTSFLQLLRQDGRMNGKLITAAIRANTAGDPSNIGYDYNGLSNYLDYVNVMTYDFYGTWENTTNRSAPFQKAKAAVDYVSDQGVTDSKIVMGLPWYGPAWTGTSSSGLNVSGTPHSVFTYRDAKQKFLDGCSSICSLVPSSTSTDPRIWCNGNCNGLNNAWVSVETAYSVDAKMDWIVDNNFGGGMYWMEGQDSVANELVSAAYASLQEGGGGGGCTGNCTGKECGDDGCGNSCGACSAGEVCNGSNQCVDDQNDVGDTGGGDCTAPAYDSTVAYVKDYKVSHNNKEYTCVYVTGCPAGYAPPFAGIWDSGTTCATCTASCDGKQCGSNGCGGSCGSCSSGETCDGSGLCVTSCIPQCDGKSCGDDGCGGSCGACPSGQTCNSSGQCVSSCTPNCTGKECGSNGCGGTCGSCGAGETCDTTGTCVSACIPSCSGKVCGQDGCGGVCGTCGSGESCNASGQCVSASSCSSVNNWTVSTSYAAGDEVKAGPSGAQKRYRCKPWPYNGWCGVGYAYEPFFGSAWRDAWDEIGDCQ